jgi:hypothetical protein
LLGDGAWAEVADALFSADGVEGVVVEEVVEPVEAGGRVIPVAATAQTFRVEIDDVGFPNGRNRVFVDRVEKIGPRRNEVQMTCHTGFFGTRSQILKAISAQRVCDLVTT